MHVPHIENKETTNDENYEISQSIVNYSIELFIIVVGSISL